MNTIIHYSDSPRVGKFLLPNALSEDRDLCRALLSLCTVLEHKPHESGQAEEFFASSPMFDPLHEGEEIPTYRIDFVANCPFDREEDEARRHNVGPFGFAATRQYILRVPPATFRAAALM